MTTCRRGKTSGRPLRQPAPRRMEALKAAEPEESVAKKFFII
jgi:hypothetical protein